MMVHITSNEGTRLSATPRIYGQLHDGSWKEVRDVSTWTDADWRVVDRHLTRPRKRMLRRERMARKRRLGWA